MAVRIGVLALQGNVREHVAALTGAGAEAVPVRRASELAAVDGIVLPGGESTTMSKLLDTFELLEPLRARLREGLPAYGSCAGMILLAEEILTGGPTSTSSAGSTSSCGATRSAGRSTPSNRPGVHRAHR